MVVKIALGFPWYAGPDPYCSVYFSEFMAYLGRLQERSAWLAKYPETDLSTLTPLDSLNVDGRSEITPDLVGTEFQFATAQEMFLSLVGMARERIVERALEWGADYVFWCDDDMIIPNSSLLSLYRNQKDICGALAFTSREPIMPVIYKFKKSFDEEKQREITDISVVEDYQRDTLQQVDAIGSGVVLVTADAYRKMGKPWYSSYGLGEDIFRCHRAAEHGIEVWVDTRVRTLHKKAMPQWHDESVYLASRPA